MQRRPPRIRWHTPPPAAWRRALELRSPGPGVVADDAEAVAPEAPPTLAAPSLEALMRAGIPIADGVADARELAIELLKLAAEVEHALMALYLYTASSVVNADDADQDYRRLLQNVAIQEMGHLATAQNLLLLLGGSDAVHMQRDVYRRASELNPIPFVLEPVSRVALAKGVAAEMPASVPPDLEDKVAALVKIATEDAHVVLHRVGAIYATIRWMFLPAAVARRWIDLPSIAPMPPNPHLTDADLVPRAEIEAFEASPEEWPSTLEDFILETPHTCAEAVVAIDRITEQGEGFGTQAHSHFMAFLQLTDAFDAGRFTALPLARSPTLVPYQGGEEGQVIASRYTKLWGAVFSLQYSLLVLTIFHVLRTRRAADGTPGLRPGLVDLALRGMKRIIPALTTLCGTLPLRDDGPALAGPPFDLDPAVLDVASESELLARHLTLLDDLAQRYSAIEHDPDFPAHPGHPVTLTNLRNFDQRRRDLLSTPPAPIA